MTDEQRRVVEAIETCDRSIERTRLELSRLKGLRASLASKLEAWGTPVPQEPDRPQGGYMAGEKAAQEWLAELENTGRSPELPTAKLQGVRMFDAPMQNDATRKLISTRPSPTPVVPLRPIAAQVSGDRRYERVSLDAGDLPNGRVWIYETPTLYEAHLGPNTTQFVGEVSCGFYAQRSKWWRAEPDDERVELCRPCAEKIPGAVLLT